MKAERIRPVRVEDLHPFMCTLTIVQRGTLRRLFYIEVYKGACAYG